MSKIFFYLFWLGVCFFTTLYDPGIVRKILGGVLGWLGFRDTRDCTEAKKQSFNTAVLHPDVYKSGSLPRAQQNHPADVGAKEETPASGSDPQTKKQSQDTAASQSAPHSSYSPPKSQQDRPTGEGAKEGTIASTSERQLKLLKRLGDAMIQNLEKDIPITPAFLPHSIYFDIIGTKNIGMLTVALSLPQKDPLKLQPKLKVLRPGTDWIAFYFMPPGDVQEIAQMLRDPSTHEQWMQQIDELSEMVDEYWENGGRPD